MSRDKSTKPSPDEVQETCEDDPRDLASHWLKSEYGQYSNLVKGPMYMMGLLLVDGYC